MYKLHAFETSLPEKEKFYNQLTDGWISNEDYKHAKNIWESFECRTLGDYSNVYLNSDVMLLYFSRSNALYYTSPGPMHGTILLQVFVAESCSAPRDIVTNNKYKIITLRQNQITSDTTMLIIYMDGPYLDHFCMLISDGEKGHILEVDLEYLQTLHDKHSDLPLCPENKAPPHDKYKKLLTMLEDKENY
ncbi:hypothetical protein J437_LFUL016717, partial [Ladona fulva]